MFKLLLISIVVVPVLFGLQTAKSRSERRGLFLLFGLVLTYGLLYVLMLFYLRVRWVDSAW
jgi:hypothetical protein